MIQAEYSNCIFEDDDVETEFNKILSEISEGKEIEHLSLMSNHLTSKQLEKLAHTISEHVGLVYLNLSINPGILSEKEGIDSLKKIIMDHDALKNIQLDYNEITDANIKALLENNSKELMEKILSIDFYFSFNHFTEESLSIARNNISTSSMLSLLNGNYHMKNSEKVNILRDQEISKLQSENEPVSKPLLLSSNALSSITRTTDKNESKKRTSDEIKDLVIDRLSNHSDKEFDEFLEDLKEKRKIHKASQQQLVS